MSAVAAAVEHVVTMLRESEEVRAVLPNLLQEGVADERAVMPYVLIQPYGDGEDVQYNGDDRALSRLELSVRVVLKALSLGALVPLASAVDRALEATSGEYDDGNGGTYVVSSCYRVNETSLAELQAGRPVRYLGGIYEVTVS